MTYVIFNVNVISTDNFFTKKNLNYLIVKTLFLALEKAYI